MRRHLFATNHFAALSDGLVEAFPEDVGHEAVDEEVGGWVDHHRQLRKVAQEQDPERQVVAVVIQRRLEILNGENLKVDLELIIWVSKKVKLLINQVSQYPLLPAKAYCQSTSLVSNYFFGPDTTNWGLIMAGKCVLSSLLETL